MDLPSPAAAPQPLALPLDILAAPDGLFAEALGLDAEARRILAEIAADPLIP